MSAKRSKSIAKELGRAKLGDPRRSARVERVAQALVERPGASLPSAMGDEASLEAAYRLLNNDAVEATLLLQPHVEATAGRARSVGAAYCISDTTEFRFGGEREGLGPLQNGGQGFLAHVALAVASDGSRLPLGVLGLETIVRPLQPKKRRGTGRSRDEADSESLRWMRVAAAAEDAVGEPGKLIHLMDREADIWSLLVGLCERRSRFVVRVAQNRLATDEEETGRLFELLNESDGVVTREVPLSRRPRAAHSHPRRSERRATLSFAARTLDLRRPTHARKVSPETLRLNFVHVFERNPPEGESPIDWNLVTTEPVETAVQIERIVDAYRARWVIEELFKALKTGCAYERAQLETFDALLNLLALQLPIAAQLLALRSLATSSQSSLASGVLSNLQLTVLRAMTRQRLKLPENPTAEQALHAIAALGGHLKNNGPPGWQVLSRGFQDLVRYTDAWFAATSQGLQDL